MQKDALKTKETDFISLNMMSIQAQCLTDGQVYWQPVDNVPRLQ